MSIWDPGTVFYNLNMHFVRDYHILLVFVKLMFELQAWCELRQRSSAVSFP